MSRPGPCAGRAEVAAVLLAALGLGAGCSGGGADMATVSVETPSGEVSLAVEVADRAAERRKGLSGRSSLGERSGMLFLYGEETRGGFWMKDTLIPLSIAFLDGAGRVLAILDMEPCGRDPCPVYEPGLAYRAALEVARGTFARLGVDVGDTVRVER